jgi:predicted ATPase
VLLVGRDEEIRLLWRLWEQSKEALGQVVLIAGEAGIGKSYLIDVLRAQGRREGRSRITLAVLGVSSKQCALSRHNAS